MPIRGGPPPFFKMPIPTTIAGLHRELPGWNIYHGEMHGSRKRYRISIKPPGTAFFLSFERRRKKDAIIAAYKAVCNIASNGASKQS